MNSSDTIAAIATPPGSGGIAIIKISGSDVEQILLKVFRPIKKDAPTQDKFIPRFLHYGHAINASGERLDDVLVAFMPAPHSVTGEDVGEIQCHGGTLIASAIFEAVVKAGARSALAGEFTKRSYLNGKIDLTQAEAVIEAIHASSHNGIKLAQTKKDGALSHIVQSLSQDLDSVRVLLTVAVDFPDEEEDIVSKEQLGQTITSIISSLESLLTSFDRAKFWREGATVVLTGQVNAGKSSLLNAFIGRDRAIVSSTPGTTRDYIEETVNIDGLSVRMLDTAGLRNSSDTIETEGIRLSKQLADNADAVLLLYDSTQGIGELEKEILEKHSDLLQKGKLILVANKIDKNSLTPQEVNSKNCPIYYISAKNGTGISELSKGIYKALTQSGDLDVQYNIAPNMRQAELLHSAVKELHLFMEDLHQGIPVDLLGIRIDTVTSYLDLVTGVSSNEQILDQIFSAFCIGK